MHVIAERGLGATNMRQVASRAGMSPGHILYYFGSKDALLLEVLKWSEADLADKRRTSLARARGQDGKLRRFSEMYLPAAAHDPRWNLWAQILADPPREAVALDAILEMEQSWIEDLTAIVGDAEVAERFCALMDGLALDILLGLPGRTRSRALRIISEAMRRELEALSSR